MGFDGFGKETFAFLRDLEKNNEKAWFDANRDRYDAHFKGVALDFIEALHPGMDALDPKLKAVPKLNGSLRRVNRDVRFSKDKSPYNPRIHLVFWSGDHPNRSPAMHFVIHPTTIGFGAGHFGMTPDTLKRHRDRILDTKERAALLAAAEAARKVGCDWGEPDLKKLPRGYQADPEWDHLLRRKGFVMRTHNMPPKPDWIETPDAVEECLNLTRACLPLIRWLAG